MKKIWIVVVLVVFANFFASTVNAQVPCETRKQKIVGTLVASGSGSIIGAFLGKGRGAAIGAISAAGGQTVSQAFVPTCNSQPRYVSNARQSPAADQDPYNKIVQRGNGEVVSVRQMNGVNDNGLTPLLVNGLQRDNYRMIARDFANDSRVHIDFYVNLNVTLVSSVQNGGGGSGFVSHFSGGGARATGGGTYRVSIEFVDARTGIIDPNRTATLLVTAIIYSSSNRNGSAYFTYVNVSGYESQSMQANDPQTEAAIKALPVMLQMQRR